MIRASTTATPLPIGNGEHEPPIVPFGPLRPIFPHVGEPLGSFRLLAELGRGAAGRVYLASQARAAGRPVVLKVTPRHDREPTSLGRLQHTNIIPLYGIYDFPELGLQALCQPYVGGASLSKTLDVLADVSPEKRTGASLVDACDRAANGPPFASPPAGAPRSAFMKATYVEAICWIGACLADALEHAHQRGLIHCDVKPSNVLLAADGQPLLLDFHLALPVLAAGQPIPPGFGGTHGSMSPEQHAAFTAARNGLPAPEEIGPRSDLFSLGRLLYLALGGDEQTSFDEPPSLRTKNRQVSPGLDAIIRKCLQSHPEDRYPTARAVAADLRRHLADEPLRGVPNRSLSERWQKWRRRRPLAPLWAGLILALVALPLFILGLVFDRAKNARESLEQGQQLLDRHHPADALLALDRAEASLDEVPGFGDLRSQIAQTRRRAERAAGADHLHAVADQMRFMIGGDIYTAPDLRTLDRHWRRVWAQKAVLDDIDSGPLDATVEEQIRDDLADLTELRGDLDRRIAANGQTPADGIVPVFHPRTSPASAWHRHIAAGRELMRRQKFDDASAEFAKAVELRPTNFWAHFFGGVCSHRLGRPADAIKEFTAALALSPESAEVYYNRGLAKSAVKDYSAAIRDFDRALAINPNFAGAALGRGIANFSERRPAQAFADFRLALERATR